MPNDSRRPRRAGLARRQPGLESLETRDLMAYSPLGFSIPDLVVTGSAAPVATYGGPLGIHLDVHNIGASSIVEPLAQAPGSGSTADSSPTTVGVYIATSPGRRGRAVLAGTIAIPSVPQNSVESLDAVISLPNRPATFPDSGGKIYVILKVDPQKRSLDSDRTNNVTLIPQPVQLAASLPDLEAISMDAPPVIQPGDSVQVNAKIANFGTVDTASQGPVLVDLVASTDTTFGPGDLVLSQVSISNLPPLADVASSKTVLGDVNIDNPLNVDQISFPVVTLPGAPPTTYFLGIVVDPNNTIREIREIGVGASAELNPARRVGPPITDLPAAGILSAPAPDTNQFPTPPFGLLTIFSATGNSTTSTATSLGVTAASVTPSVRRVRAAARTRHLPQGAIVNGGNSSLGQITIAND